MELHYCLDKNWKQRGDCAHNYNLVVDLGNKTYKIYVSPFMDMNVQGYRGQKKIGYYGLY